MIDLRKLKIKQNKIENDGYRQIQRNSQIYIEKNRQMNRKRQVDGSKKAEIKQQEKLMHGGRRAFVTLKTAKNRLFRKKENQEKEQNITIQ